MKTAIILALILFSTQASSNELFLDINGLSWHSKDTYVYHEIRETEPRIGAATGIGKPQEYNGKNAGLGLTYVVNNYLETFVGFYDNSYNRDTVYGGLRLKHDFLVFGVTVTPSLNIGAATGYSDTPVRSDYYQLVIMPAVRVTYNGFGVTIGYLPLVERDNLIAVSTITAQVNVRLFR